MIPLIGRLHILVVDDEAVSQTVLAKLLARFGDCDVANDGQEAYDMFMAAHGELRPYDLITVDLDMPKLNGHQLAEKIRKWEESYRCYELDRCATLFMVTGDASKNSVHDAFRHGCEAYVVKPVQQSDLEQALADAGLHATERSRYLQPAGGIA